MARIALSLVLLLVLALLSVALAWAHRAALRFSMILTTKACASTRGELPEQLHRVPGAGLDELQAIGFCAAAYVTGTCPDSLADVRARLPTTVDLEPLPGGWGVFVRQDERAVVAIRGTATVADVWMDVAGSLRTGARSGANSDNLQAIYGRFDAAAALLSAFIASRMDDGVRSLGLTGHSVGGALACLVMLRLGDDDSATSRRTMAVLAVASPKFGTSEIVARLEDRGRAVLLANLSDVVPLTPPGNNHARYRQLNLVRHFDIDTGGWVGNHTLQTYGRAVREGLVTWREGPAAHRSQTRWTKKDWALRDSDGACAGPR